MKKLGFIQLILLASISCFGQKKSTGQENKWGIGIQVNTIEQFIHYERALFDNVNFGIPYGEWKSNYFSGGIKATFLFNENTFLNWQTGLTKININLYTDTRTNPSVPGPGYTLGNQDISHIQYYFTPRLGWQMKENKFGLFGGLSLPYTFYKEYNIEGNGKHYDAGNTIDYEENYHSVAPGGFSIGLGAFVGFDFHFKKNLSIGAEISSAYAYYKLGGEITNTTETIIPSGSPDISWSYLFTVKGFEFSGQKLSFNITFLF